MRNTEIISKGTQNEPGSALVSPVQYVNRLDQFEAIFAAQTEAVICNREVPKNLEAWFNNLPSWQFLEEAFILEPDHVSACVTETFEAMGVGRSPMLNWLSEDIARLAQSLSKTMATAYVRMRLEAVSNDACRRFHIDNVRARLICTYHGPGTQISTSDASSTDIETIPTGAPVLLKGKLWPEADDLSLKHRSPPISGTGLSRFVLVLEAKCLSDIHPIYDKLYPDHGAFRHG